MSGNYTVEDVLAEIEELAPKETYLTRVDGLTSGEDFLTGLKASLFRMNTADPDTSLGLMRKTSARIVRLCTEVTASLVNIDSLLSTASGPDSTLDISVLENIRTLLESAREGTYPKRVRELTRLRNEINKLVSTATRAGNFSLNNKDPEDVKDIIISELQDLDTKISRITTLNENFVGFLSSNFTAGGFQYAIDEQVNLIERRMQEYFDRGGRGSSRAILTASVGLGLLEERTTIRNPLDPKYEGTVTVLDGTLAQVSTRISVPVDTNSDLTETITVDGDTGDVTIGESQAAVMTTVPVTISLISPFNSLLPYPSGAKIKYLVNNDTVEAVNGSAMNDLSEVAAFIDGTSADISCVDSGEQLIITTTNKGSTARFAFYDSADAGVGEYDLNADFQLTYERYGEAYGTSSDIEEVTTSGFTTSEPTITTKDELILVDHEVTPAVFAPGFCTITIPEGVDVTLGDTVRVHADSSAGVVEAFYQCRGQAGTLVLLKPEIRGVFDGTTYTGFDSTQVTVDFIRNGLVITSPSAEYGTSSITLNSAGTDLLPEGIPSVGTHDAFTIDTTLNLGSPIRIGDVVVTNDEQELLVGRVVGINGSAVVVEPDGGTLSTNDVKIYALGAYTYSSMFSSAFDLIEKLDDLPIFDRFRSKLGVFMGTGTSRHMVNEDLATYLTLIAEVKAAHEAYQANIPSTLNAFMKSLAESRLTAVQRKLEDLDLAGFYAMTATDISDTTTLTQLGDEIISALGGDEELIEITVDRSTYERDFVPDSEFFEYPNDDEEVE